MVNIWNFKINQILKDIIVYRLTLLDQCHFQDLALAEKKNKLYTGRAIWWAIQCNDYGGIYRNTPISDQVYGVASTQKLSFPREQGNKNGKSMSTWHCQGTWVRSCMFLVCFVCIQSSCVCSVHFKRRQTFF